MAITTRLDKAEKAITGRISLNAALAGLPDNNPAIIEIKNNLSGLAYVTPEQLFDSMPLHFRNEVISEIKRGLNEH